MLRLTGEHVSINPAGEYWGVLGKKRNDYGNMLCNQTKTVETTKTKTSKKGPRKQFNIWNM